MGRARGGLMGIHGHPPLCMLRYEDAQRRNGSGGLLPARPSSYRSAYGLVGGCDGSRMPMAALPAGHDVTPAALAAPYVD